VGRKKKIPTPSYAVIIVSYYVKKEEYERADYIFDQDTIENSKLIVEIDLLELEEEDEIGD